MFYYLKDKNNKVVCFNTDREIVKNTIPFLKHIQNFTEKDIIETKEELISRYNEESQEMEIVFLKDIENEVLKELKQQKINHLQSINKENIFQKYTVETQIDILSGIKPQLSIEDMRLWISTSLNAYEITLWRINSCKTVAEARTFNEEEDFNKNLQIKELQTNTQLEESKIKQLLK